MKLFIKARKSMIQLEIHVYDVIHTKRFNIKMYDMFLSKQSE